VEIAMDIEQQNGEESQTNDKEIAVSFDDALASCGEFISDSKFLRFSAKKQNGILDLRQCLQMNLSILISFKVSASFTPCCC
jgi:hypothetical protein